MSDNHTLRAKLTTGELYTGNQSFKGYGQQRFCLLCKEHRPYRDGRMHLGHWVCGGHPKKEVANA